MKQFLLLLMVAFTLGSCEIYDRVDELELTADALTKEDGYLSAALVEANIALADATALLEAAIAENAQLSADNAALIAANMTEVDIKLAEIIASDELTAQEISDLEASVNVVKEDVMAYVDAQIDALQAELTAAIADGDKDAINKLQADIDAAIAAGLRGEDGADGQDGQDGAPGQAGQAGQDGTPGQDGAPGADGTGSGVSYDDAELRSLISTLDTTISNLGAHTDITQLQSDLAAITAELANAVDSDTVYDDTELRGLISALSDDVTALADALANAGIDVEDEIVSSSSSSQSGGNETLTTAGTFGDWSPATAASTEATIAQTRTKTDVYTTSALIETTVVSYTVQINGVEDVPAKVAPATETTTRTVTAESTRNDVINETQTIPNPAYVAANAPDVWSFVSYYGGEESNSVITYNEAPSDSTIETYTKIGTETYDVAAYGENQVLTVNDAPDVAGTATGDTRQIETTPAYTGLTRQASSETVNNPNYVAPVAGFTSVSGSIAHSANIDIAVLQDSNGAQVTTANFSWSYSGPPTNKSLSFSFDADEAGTYYIETAQSVTHELSGVYIYFQVDVDTDGNTTVTKIVS